MATATVRDTLATRKGERFHATAFVARFSLKIGRGGDDVPTVLLTDIRDATTGELLINRIWFTAGVWANEIRAGDRIAFTAYFGLHYSNNRRDPWNGPSSRDWRLARPTAVLKLPIAAAAMFAEPAEGV